jgi:hypothetical protein
MVSTNPARVERRLGGAAVSPGHAMDGSIKADTAPASARRRLRTVLASPVGTMRDTLLASHLLWQCHRRRQYQWDLLLDARVEFAKGMHTDIAFDHSVETDVRASLEMLAIDTGNAERRLTFEVVTEPQFSLKVTIA